MGQHARLSASAAHRWMACAGSVGGQSDPSIHAATGTFAHEIAAKCLTDPAVVPGDFYLQRKTIDGFEVECDQEMIDGVRVYLDYCNSDLQDGDVEWVEMPLLEELQSIDKDLGGTADRVRYRPSTRELAVNDFKYGSGVYVEVVDSKQQKMYSLGALLKVLRMGFKVDTVKNVVVQPRYEGASPVRETTFKALDLLDFAADVQDAAEATRRPNPPLVAGDHCDFCPKRRTCPELEKHHHAVVSAALGEVVDVQQISTLLAAIPLAKQRISAIEEHAYKLAVQGVEIPGFKLVDKIARRKWKRDGDVIEWAEKNAIDPYAPRELLSPAALESKLKEAAPRGKKKEVVAALQPFYEKVSSGTALVPLTDDRPAVKRLDDNDFAVVDGAAKPPPQAIVNLFN